ncbi:MAG TPA: hypothetical protein VFB96_20595 [Pirellulaceae bacterium]|nr:hypothetical protein [Pirellulaceae bacterium]
MSFARWVFRIAGIYGVLVIAPMYFLEERFGRDMPPPLNHPEFFYGFAGVALAWQVAFLVISFEPARYRLMMIPAIVEKFSFTAAAVVLLVQGRIPLPMFAGAMLDLVWGVLFVAAFVATMPRAKEIT